MKKGRLDRIITSVKTQQTLPDTFVISISLVCIRTGQKSIMVMNKSGKGNTSPLLQYKPEFIELMIQMSRMHRKVRESDHYDYIQ